MNTKTLFGILGITAAFAMTGSSQVQIYQFTTPINGFMTMSVQDFNGPPGSSGAITNYFSSLSETVYLDPVGQTLREVGTISYTPSATNIKWEETQQVGQFPNPLTNVFGSVTVNLAPTGGTLSFDTGPQGVGWDDALQAYFVNEVVGGIPMSGAYSLTTGGQTYTGQFSYTLNHISDGYWITTYNVISLTNYPLTLQLSGLGQDYNYAPVTNWGRLFTDETVEVTASNGFQMQLGPAAEQYAGASQIDIFEWSSPSVTATNVANAEPLITTQSQSALVHGNNPASFSVTATGALPLSYQWSFNGSNISGATSSTFTIPSVVQTNLGTYGVVVSNQFGTNISTNVTLSMYPYISNPFTGAVTYWGQSNTLSVGAWGTGPLDYQWFDNGSAINGATNDTLMLTAIQATNAGLYSVVVSSSLGSATNTPAQVIVEPAGVSLTFSPTLTINGVIGYTYIIQGTTNLANTNAWTTLTNLTLTQSVQQWFDTNVNASSPLNSTHFYQVLPGQ